MVSLGRSPSTARRSGPNASRGKAMSYAPMSEKQKILGAEVSDLPEAERIDKDEDAGFGKDNKGYGLADELARRQGRLAKIAGRRRRWRPKPPSGPPPRRPSGPAPLARTRTHRRTSRRGSIPGGPETAGATELHRPGVEITTARTTRSPCSAVIA